MNGKRILKTSSILLLVGVGFFAVYFRIPFTPISRLEAERGIYTALTAENLVFESHTTLGYLEPSDEIIEYIRGEAPRVEDDTLNDFWQINSQVYLLEAYLPANIVYVLLSDAEIEKFYANWEGFSVQYPSVRLINSFSRVGFNSNYSQAIVLKGSNAKIFNAPFDYSGDEIIYVFKRIGERWFKQFELVVSITG